MTYGRKEVAFIMEEPMEGLEAGNVLLLDWVVLSPL